MTSKIFNFNLNGEQISLKPGMKIDKAPKELRGFLNTLDYAHKRDGRLSKEELNFMSTSFPNGVFETKEDGHTLSYTEEGVYGSIWKFDEEYRLTSRTKDINGDGKTDWQATVTYGEYKDGNNMCVTVDTDGDGHYDTRYYNKY